MDPAFSPVENTASGKFHRNMISHPLTASFHEIRKDPQAVNLRWHNIKYSVGPKEILKGVSGRVNAGELCAILGPSGSGKTTLLNCLAGRISKRKGNTLSGTVTVNDKLIHPLKFRKNVAYVIQEDSLYATATTRESLEFSAKLRLPSSVTDEERKTIVDDLIDGLGLKHVENSLCGSELIRGLSGGERKRVSIGVELVTSPNIVFLDEPTSGLDSYSAWKVVSILKALSSSCTVLFSVHQPNSETFSLVDYCMVLRLGLLMYGGSVIAIESNLDSLGHQLPRLTNPADFLVLLAQNLVDDEMFCFCEDTELPNLRCTSNSFKVSIFELSKMFGHSELLSFESRPSFLLQLSAQVKRELLMHRRDVHRLVTRYGTVTFIFLLMGCVFYQAGNQANEGYTLTTHYGAVVNILITSLFSASQPPLTTFASDRAVFEREYSTRTYSSISYLLSKMVTESVMFVVEAFNILAVIYWLMGLQGNFFVLVFLVFLTQIVVASMALALGAATKDAKQAQAISPVIFVPQLLFSGYFVSIDQIPIWLRWIQNICSLKYGINLFAIAEFGGERCAIPGDPTASKIAIAQCEYALEINDISDDSTGLYLCILFGVFATCRVLSCICLVYRAHFRDG